MSPPTLEVEGLEVEGLAVRVNDGPSIVEDVSFSLARGEILGVVGESGSGKTTTALALLGFAQSGARITAGRVTIAGTDILKLGPKQLRAARGQMISYVPQDPGASLDPSMRIGKALEERFGDDPPTDRADRVRKAMAYARLPSDDAFLRRYPFQLSGGQQQRLLIAMALLRHPPVVVFDEPTTGLDMVTQAALLEQIAELRRAIGFTGVYVSHDIAVVSQVCDRIAVMYAGRLIELGEASEVLRQPSHPYTVGLLEGAPDVAVPRQLRGVGGEPVGVGEWPAGCAYAPRCPMCRPECTAALPPIVEVANQHLSRCIRSAEVPAPTVLPLHQSEARISEPPLLAVSDLRLSHRQGHHEVIAAENVSFKVGRGECVALVGESGSGKTTIARAIVGLHPPDRGHIWLDGEQIPAVARERSRATRRRLQVVFQNPFESLNPRHTVADAVIGPAMQLRNLSKRDARDAMLDALGSVRLARQYAERYPAELSGGERQRVAIARALVAEPDALVCDEITSALDLSVQASVLTLVQELQATRGLSLLFITHDLGLVSSVAQRVLVLDRGELCEQGSVEQVLRSPTHEYTRALVDATPTMPERALHELS